MALLTWPDEKHDAADNIQRNNDRRRATSLYRAVMWRTGCRHAENQ